MKNFEIKNLSDVLRWITRTGSVTDTNHQIFHPCGLFEEDMDAVIEIVERELWKPIQSLYDLDPKFIFENSFLMFSEKNWVRVAYHGYDDKGKIVWFFGDGEVMENPTHWRYMPKPPAEVDQ